ncbi:23S rRNA (adenine(2503)-C(2))-methyltransferase RlmN [Lyticum sinuosum]|uniref:Dual-specificity RNA methyltransferase RlmN n=1 Tax=Lyticum sinuosum TaxID=1332059 RepID=A0AAE4VM41_9RICK|nr:23S rRNA (adenine(2503)-C(2))-methyltransferase RlmN [Lyticum sinuosum]MDZ5761441.1 Dual-specificity RNA methyltransferase RlmN [Lyticum sinuosum]
MEKEFLYGLNKEEIRELLQKNLLSQKYIADQIWDWIYNKGVKRFDEMTNLSRNLQEKLKDIFFITSPNLKEELMSSDGTCKWLLDLSNKSIDQNFEDSYFLNKRYSISSQNIETVYIPDYTRSTVCVSSQIGCALSCSFCHTGTQKLVRNIRTDEIISQVLFTKTAINDWRNKRAKLTNIVFMGMGEPFLNYDSVEKAILILCDDKGLNISRKKITVSTSGIIPGIIQCADNLRVKLAVSLHSPDDSIRNEIVPINKKYPIKDLLNACKYYAEKTNNERITFEYVMLDGVNDSDSDAYHLISILKDIPAKINIIPFNPWPNSKYSCSDEKRINSFANIMESGRYFCSIRKPRGQDIMGACGQLRSNSEKILLKNDT